MSTLDFYILAVVLPNIVTILLPLAVLFSLCGVFLGGVVWLTNRSCSDEETRTSKKGMRFAKVSAAAMSCLILVATILPASKESLALVVSYHYLKQVEGIEKLPEAVVKGLTKLVEENTK